MNWLEIILLLAAVVVLLLAFQIWRKGGIDKTKVDEVVEGDTDAVKKAGSSVVAAIKKLFHKEQK